MCRSQWTYLALEHHITADNILVTMYTPMLQSPNHKKKPHIDHTQKGHASIVENLGTLQGTATVTHRVT
jgi:hypothetical protein